MKILVLDNYDSFTYNLVYIIRDLGFGAQLDIYRNDAISLEAAGQYDKILLSPGPGVPDEAGIMPALIKQYGASKDILGVCLGHQGIAEAYGASLHNLSEVVHGLATQIKVENTDHIFEGLPREFRVGRYHSWVVNRQTMPAELIVTSTSPDGQVMSFKHAQHEVRGVQFHPESVLTENGVQLMQNWLTFNPKA
ncbi:anthranilate synthase component II [Penaeicola halotolerans]|uniref:anthranilate synthase component II n=1 Tax=Penaeicola halotolerans TaxID=2793196 RepID=UPI001CF7F0BC|nr:aminodeoxychorismate/anthranilate synthase component II [Penaeicola halotolerans]